MKKLLIISLLLSVVGVQAGQNDDASNRLKILAEVLLNGQSQLQQDYMDLPPLIPLEPDYMNMPPAPTFFIPEEIEHGGQQNSSNQVNKAPGGKWTDNQCSCCGKLFAKKHDLTRHMRTHTGEKPYVCKQTGCGMRFSHKSHLNTHMRRHTGEKPYKCDECLMEFSDQSSFKRHMRTHTGEKPYKCDECSKKFSDQSSFKRHKRTHTGGKPYVCKQTGCGMRFSHKSNLNTHIRTHTGEKPYKCGNCDYSSAFVDDVKKHERIHSGERPYVCPKCGKGFSDKSNLNRHVNHKKTPCEKISGLPVAEENEQENDEEDIE